MNDVSNVPIGNDKKRLNISLRLRQIGIFGFWFFFLKGCLWIGALGMALVVARG